MTLADRLRAEGEARGRAQGKAEGKAEGRSELRVRQLQLKFGTVPTDTLQRVEAANAEQLDRVAELILSAETLEEVLAPLAE